MKQNPTHWLRVLWTLGHDSIADRQSVAAYLLDLQGLSLWIHQEEHSRENDFLDKMIQTEIEFWKKESNG